MPHPRSTVLDLQELEDMPRYYAWKAELLSPHLGPRVLELGCGTGTLLDHLAPREALFGVDCDPACVARARTRLAGRTGAVILEADAAGPAWEPEVRARGGVTGVAICNALELMADDAGVVRRAAAILPPGGRLAVFASAGPWLTGALDRAYGQRRYRRRDLEAMLEAAGLRLVESRPVNLLGALAWFWESRVVGRVAPPDGSHESRDRLVPWCRWADRLTGPPFGRTVLVAAGKR